MLFARYDLTKRTKIILCSSDIEGLENLEVENETITQMIKNKYSDTIFDVPYHYIVFENSIEEVKSPDLAHNCSDNLKPYNHDIKILIAKKKYYSSARRKIIDLVARLSCKYGILLQNNFMLMDNTTQKVVVSEYNKILTESIIKRNSLNPIFNICETIIDKKIVTNENVMIFINRGQYESLKDVSNHLMVPLNTIREMNTHLDDIVKMGDIILVPFTDALKYKMSSINIIKDSEYLLNSCKENLGGE